MQTDYGLLGLRDEWSSHDAKRTTGCTFTDGIARREVILLMVLRMSVLRMTYISSHLEWLRISRRQKY